MRTLRADSDKTDRLDRQGFRVEGWFKPAADDEVTAPEKKRYNVSMLAPEKKFSIQAALNNEGVSETNPFASIASTNWCQN